MKLSAYESCSRLSTMFAGKPFSHTCVAKIATPPKALEVVESSMNTRAFASRRPRFARPGVFLSLIPVFEVTSKNAMIANGVTP